MKIGVNTWVWTSPLTTEGFATLAAQIAGMGFDLVEVPIENRVHEGLLAAQLVATTPGPAPSRAITASP